MAGLMLPQGGGFWNKGQEHARGALAAYGSQGQKRQTEINPPGKTASEGLMAGVGGAAAGYSIGGMVGGAAAGAGTGAATGSSAGPWGAAIGAGVGLLAYLLS